MQTKRSHRHALVALALAASAATGVLFAANSAHASEPTPAPTASHRTAKLTEADNGAKIHVRRGDTVIVELTPSAKGFAWSAPTTNAPTVLTTEESKALPDGSARGVFLAHADGTATIRAHEQCRPQTNQVCPYVVLGWSATVTVS